MHKMTLVALTLALGVSASAQNAALTRIGAAGAVKGAVNAQAPGAVGRIVESGKPMFMNDHVTTSAAGRLQVLLLDETVFTLGPNSDMVLDEFVYNPATESGKVTARVTKGVFRFVTGKVARRDPASMNVKLPSGTIGIRGTIVLGQIDNGVETVILGGPGDRGNSDETRGAFVFDNKFVGEPGNGIVCQNGKCSGVQDLADQANRITQLLSSALDANNQKPGNGGSATDQSGQRRASAKGDSLIAIEDDAARDEQALLLKQVATDAHGGANGATTWDQMNNNAQLGTASYTSPTANGICTGSVCSSNPNVQYDFTLSVNFAQRQISSGQIQISGAMSDTINFSGVPFGTGGSANLTLSSTQGSGSNGGNAQSSTIQFVNSGGDIAKQAALNLNYHNSTNNGFISNQGVSGSR